MGRVREAFINYTSVPKKFAIGIQFAGLSFLVILIPGYFAGTDSFDLNAQTASGTVDNRAEAFLKPDSHGIRHSAHRGFLTDHASRRSMAVTRRYP